MWLSRMFPANLVYATPYDILSSSVMGQTGSGKSTVRGFLLFRKFGFEASNE